MKKPNDQIIRESIEYLEKNNILTMATATLDGIPRADALEYANDNLNVFVLSVRKSWKVSNICKNHQVFYEVHHNLKIDIKSLKGIIGIQVEANAEIISQQDSRFNKYFKIMEKKFPVFKNRLGLEKRVILLFKPKKLWLLDYSKSFFHRDQINFE